jgi:predicted nucleic acid-binding protein
MDIVYIETSIVSHATAWPSSDIQIAALQHQARNWWSIERPKFELVTSQLVIDEASAGDPAAAAERLKLLDGLPTVPIDDDVRTLARAIVTASMMPPRAAADALHIAAAAVAGVQYLLTLNCKHIANAHELPRIYRLLDDHGFGQLLICTPAEFLGGDEDDDKESHP